MKISYQPSADIIVRTRNHFVDIYRGCIEEAKSGEVRVNDLDKYIIEQEQRIRTMLAGEGDHTFTFIQRAFWLETGESVPLLPK